MIKLSTIGLIFLFFAACQSGGDPAATREAMQSQEIMKDNGPKLRHVVLLKFKSEATEADIQEVEKAFSALPSKIPQIKGYEWGTNNSPEGLNHGYTHCFFLTFDSEEDRDVYLPHPDHKAFGEILHPHMEEATVVDYWTND